MRQLSAHHRFEAIRKEYDMFPWKVHSASNHNNNHFLASLIRRGDRRKDIEERDAEMNSVNS